MSKLRINDLESLDTGSIVPVSTLAGLPAEVSRRVIYVDTVSDMLALVSSEIPDGAVIVTAQYGTLQPTGGSRYTFDAASTETVNGGTVLKPDDSTSGRFLKIPEQSVSVYEFGLESGSGANATSNSTAFQAAVDSLDTGNIYGGGVIETGTGIHYLDSEITVSGTEPTNIYNIAIEGSGKQGSSFDFTSAPATHDGFIFINPKFVTLKDISAARAPKSGVKVASDVEIADGKAWNHVDMENIRSSYNGLHGFEFERGFMGRFDHLFSTHNTGNGFEFLGFHTSLSLNSCYADKNSSGFRLNELTYSNLTACASDNNSGYGYIISDSSTLSLMNCGAESSGRSGVLLDASATKGVNRNIMLNGFLSFNSNIDNGGYPNAIHMTSADNTENTAIAIGCRSQLPANPTVDVLVSGEGSHLVEGYNDFPNGVSSNNKGYIQHIPKVKIVRELSVTAATTVTGLLSPQGHSVHYGGEIIVRALSGDPSTPSVTNTATYKLLVDKGAGGSNITEISKIGLTAGGSPNHPSFTWTFTGNNLVATPVGSTSGTFTFEVLTDGFVKVV